jgi:hypothetical protein
MTGLSEPVSDPDRPLTAVERLARAMDETLRLT